MRVFVTGGTGFVGREVVRALRSAGHSARLLARSPDAPRLKQWAAQMGAELRGGNVLVPASLEGALTGTDAVVHLVGIISEVGSSTFENVHLGGTRNILTAAKAQGVGRMVHMSALGTRAGAASRYHQSKWAAEESVRSSGLDWTIFRPSLIYGPEDHFTSLFARIARFSPVVPVMGSGQARFQPVSVRAVAAAFAKAVTEPKAIGKEYGLCGPETLTFTQIVDGILAASGRKRWKVRVPLGLAGVQARFLEWLFPSVLGKAAPLNRDQLIMLQEDNVCDNRAADELFGLQQPAFREEIAAYLAPRRAGDWVTSR